MSGSWKEELSKSIHDQPISINFSHFDIIAHKLNMQFENVAEFLTVDSLKLLLPLETRPFLFSPLFCPECV